ncbi:Concanavalin A-like lectin/glucanases superfamily protein [uncultured archaeon]|nr:Concanavalin A-like lectin/glucanases superfamily protein [uncultured archaeon]
MTGLALSVRPHMAEGVDGDGWAIAGRDSGNSNHAEVYFAPIDADGSIGAWASTASLPIAMNGPETAVYGNTIYITGGDTADGGSPTNNVYYATPNPDGTITSWNRAADTPGSRWMHSVAIANGYIYSMGGSNGAVGTSDLYYGRIEPDGNITSWVSSSLPGAWYNTFGVSHGDYIYVVGLDSTQIAYAQSNPSDGSLGPWSYVLLPSSGGFASPRAAFIGGTIYILAGYDYDNPGPSARVVYAPVGSDGSIGSWSEAASLPSGRWMPGVASDGQHLFSVGGWDPAYSIVDTVYYHASDSSAISPDLIGGLNATLVDVTAINGSIGNALSFNGISGHASIPSRQSFENFSQFTYEMWVNASSMPESASSCNSGMPCYVLLSKDNMFAIALTNDSGQMRIESSFGNGVDWGTTTYTQSTGTLSLNEDHHIAVVHSGGNILYYIDGQPAGLGTDDEFNLGSNSQDISVGDLCNPTCQNHWFNGTLDEIAIHRKALSSNEVRQHYTNGVMGGEGYCIQIPTCLSGMISYWKAENNANDEFGLNNGTLEGGASYGTGKFGQAFSLDGVDDYVSEGDTGFPTGAGDMTIGAWINIVSGSIIEDIFSYGHRAVPYYNEADYYRDISFSCNTDGANCYLNMDIYGENSGNAATAVTTGVWHYAVAVFSGQTVKLYLDGNLDLTKTFTNTRNVGLDGIAYIGSNANQRTPMEGSMDEVVIFNRSLTAEEVQQLYALSSGGQGYCISVSAYVPSIGTLYPVENLNITSAVDYAYEFGPSNEITIKNPSGSAVVVFPSGTTGDVTVNVSNTSAGGGLVLINGATLPGGQSKSVLVPRLLSSGSVCFKDEEGVASISAACDETGETRLSCPGASGSVTCAVEGDAYNVTGLLHSGVGEVEIIQYFTAGWSDVTPATLPNARFYFGHQMAYDSNNGIFLLSGGRTGDNTQSSIGETWVYNLSSTAWTQMSPSISPSKELAAVTYDSIHDVFILFGGYDSGDSSETWAYNYSSDAWTLMSPPSSPIARTDHMMVFDSRAGVAVMFGGYGLSDTWIYNYSDNTWTQKASAPFDRSEAGMVYDTSNDIVVLFGGQDGSGTPNSDTWIYNLSSDAWTEMSPSQSPPVRRMSGMAFDSMNNVSFILGGVNFGVSSDPLEDFWSYNYSSNTWSQVNSAISPPPRMSHAMGFDASRAAIVIFGGLGTWVGSPRDDVWAYGVATAAPQPPAPTCPAGMVSYWRAEDDSDDLLGLNNGTWSGTEAYDVGKVGHAFNFDGSNYITVPHDPSLSPTDAITLEAWINPTSSALSGYSPFVSNWNDVGADQRTYSFWLQDGKAAFYLSHDGTSAITAVVGSTTLIADTWYHVVGTFDGTDMNVYVNGASDAAPVNYPGVIMTNDRPVYIGRGDIAGSSRYFSGLVDEATVYNNSLTTDEIQQHYQNGLNSQGYCAAAPSAPLSINITAPANDSVLSNRTITVNFTVSGADLNRINVSVWQSDGAVDNYIWIANSDANTVSKVDKSTDGVAATVSVGSYPLGIATDTDSVWVANQGSGTISRIDKADNSVLANIAVGSNP